MPTRPSTAGKVRSNAFNACFHQGVAVPASPSLVPAEVDVGPLRPNSNRAAKTPSWEPPSRSPSSSTHSSLRPASLPRGGRGGSGNW